jgi:hypothetical protein
MEAYRLGIAFCCYRLNECEKVIGSGIIGITDNDFL